MSAIVHLTGGVASYFASLYTLPIIAASTVQSWRGGLMVSVLSSLVYTSLVVAQYQAPGLLPLGAPPDALPLLRVAIFTVGLNVFGFLAVAALSGYLAEGLRRTGAQLARASSQLEDLQAFNQHVIDSLTSGLATSDMDGRILTFNRAAETITGAGRGRCRRPPDHATSCSCPARSRTCSPPGPGPPARSATSSAITAGTAAQIEIGMTSAPLITPRGETGFLFTFQDVTELKKRDREARVQQRLAAVGEMAAGIAHEIRNPLASMAGSIQILRDELPLTPDQSQLMDIVLRESDRLNDTIRSFLSFAKPQRMAVADLDVRADPHRHGAAAREQRGGHRGPLDRGRGAGPAGRVPRRRSADPADRLEPGDQRPAGDARRAAQLRLRAEMPAGRAPATAAEMAVGVDDEGVGIAPEDVDGIFQPFRGGFANGTGLGLVDRPPHRQRLRRRGPRRLAAGQGHQRRSRAAAWPGLDTAYQWAVADGPQRIV